MCRYSKLIMTLGLAVPMLLCSVTAKAQVAEQEQQDSVMIQQDSVVTQIPVDPSQIIRHEIHTIVRNYGNTVKLRWAPNRFASWEMLNKYGYQIIRVERKKGKTEIVHLVDSLRPLSAEAFRDRFGVEDSLAMAAASLIHGERTTLATTRRKPNTLGSILELENQQQNTHSFAMLVAEMRFDVAEAMALAYTDRTADPDAEYEYIVKSCVPTEMLEIMAVRSGDREWKLYEPEKMTYELKDSLMPPYTVYLTWPPTKHFAYDVERKRDGETEWTRLNDRPYVSMYMDLKNSPQINRFADSVTVAGTYKYRMRGYDSFGDVSEFGPEYTVVVPDMITPTSPVIRQFIVHRDDNLKLNGVDVLITKDTIESDMVGYDVLYYNKDLTKGRWIKLNRTPFAPTDTLLQIRMTGIETGSIVVAAVDTAGNLGKSHPTMIHVSDYTPPQPPTNVRSAVSPTGVVLLAWTPPADRDVRGYRVLAANDTTHTFMNITPGGLIMDTVMTDTIALDANQRYIYYQVIAEDFGGNMSKPSKTHRRSRPNFTAPRPCLLDSVWQDNEFLHTRWVAAPEVDVVKYILYRKLGGKGKWEIVKELTDQDVDPVTKTLTISDSPEYNRKERYYYAMECFNETGCRSGLSTTTSFSHKGPKIIDAGLKLFVKFDEKKNEATLAWEVGKTPKGVDYHVVVYRRSNDELFRGIMTFDSSILNCTDLRTRPGEKAEYYVKLIFSDDRQSRPSNIVKVENNRKVDETKRLDRTKQTIDLMKEREEAAASSSENL